MFAVDENPISKFNFLAKHLSELIEKDLKEYNKEYNKALKTYFKKEKKIFEKLSKDENNLIEQENLKELFIHSFTFIYEFFLHG